MTLKRYSGESCLLAYFERTRTPLTSFIQSFWFPMIFFSSISNDQTSIISQLVYICCCWSSSLSCAMLRFPEYSSSLTTSSFLLQQCPIKRSLLIFSLSVILGRLPYSSLLVLCSFQETPRTALSILVYVP